MAFLAVEMDMGVLVVIMIMTKAQLVAGAFHVLNGMHEVIVPECHQAAEYAGLIHRSYLILKFSETERPSRV